MVSHLFFYQLVLLALLWLCFMLHWAWPSDSVAVCPTTPEPPGPRPKRTREPQPFADLTQKPHCDACEHRGDPRSQTPSSPPPRIVMTRGRRRQVDTSTHFCPNPDCAYRGWLGLGNLRANGHPHGGPWGALVKRGHLMLPSFGALRTFGAPHVPGPLPVAELSRCLQAQSLAFGRCQSRPHA